MSSSLENALTGAINEALGAIVSQIMGPLTKLEGAIAMTGSGTDTASKISDPKKNSSMGIAVSSGAGLNIAKELEQIAKPLLINIMEDISVAEKMIPIIDDDVKAVFKTLMGASEILDGFPNAIVAMGNVKGIAEALTATVEGITSDEIKGVVQNFVNDNFSLPNLPTFLSTNIQSLLVDSIFKEFTKAKDTFEELVPTITGNVVTDLQIKTNPKIIDLFNILEIDDELTQIKILKFIYNDKDVEAINLIEETTGDLSTERENEIIAKIESVVDR